MTGWNYKRVLSLITAVLGFVGLVYAAGGQYFGWAMGEEIQQFLGIVVSGLSTYFGATTVSSVIADKNAAKKE